MLGCMWRGERENPVTLRRAWEAYEGGYCVYYRPKCGLVCSFCAISGVYCTRDEAHRVDSGFVQTFAAVVANLWNSGNGFIH